MARGHNTLPTLLQGGVSPQRQGGVGAGGRVMAWALVTEYKGGLEVVPANAEDNEDGEEDNEDDHNEQ